MEANKKVKLTILLYNINIILKLTNIKVWRLGMSFFP